MGLNMPTLQMLFYKIFQEKSGRIFLKFSIFHQNTAIFEISTTPQLENIIKHHL
jgi:hypothetical protein